MRVFCLFCGRGDGDKSELLASRGRGAATATAIVAWGVEGGKGRGQPQRYGMVRAHLGGGGWGGKIPVEEEQPHEAVTEAAPWRGGGGAKELVGGDHPRQRITEAGPLHKPDAPAAHPVVVPGGADDHKQTKQL